MIYRFRVILDVEEDVFRDIEIEKTASLEDFHNAIVQAFGFDGREMASFYKSDKNWNQGEEFGLFSEENAMQTTILESVVSKKEPYLLYVYDFMNMWSFFVELHDEAEKEQGITYPHLLLAEGLVPSEAPEKNFLSEDEFNDEFNDFEFDQEEFDEYYGYNDDEYGSEGGSEGYDDYY